MIEGTLTRCFGIGFEELILVVSLCWVLLSGGAIVYANTYELIPSPADLYDLDHHRYYTWGISTPWDVSNEIAVSATFSFDNIRNWRDEPNVLYIHLLDDADLGVTQYRDNQQGGDNFAGEGVLLKVYRDLPASPMDLSFSFTPEQLAVLNSYSLDGVFAMGFDPDCHFYNDGAKLTVETLASSVPEPSTIVLMLGIASFWLAGRRKNNRLV